jgi:adenosylcobinamide-phosphate synthase
MTMAERAVASGARAALLSRAGALAAAFLLDRAIGDPVRATHPARLLGHAIFWYERGVRRFLGSAPRPRAERTAGIVLAVVLPWATWRLTGRTLSVLPPVLRLGAEVWLLSTALAGRDLGEHARRVDDGLGISLEEGRRRVGLIVGRRTERLSEDEVVRATVETVAENTSDGLVAPLVYGVLGGAPLALAFKAVSTLDSMVGYRDRRYRDLGWASARLDDLANLAPARLTAVLATLVSGRGWSTMRLWWGERDRHSSPNAGLVEAAFAHSLGVQLGGGAWYGDDFVERSPVGDGLEPPARQDIARSIRLSETVGAAALGGGLALLLTASWRRGREGR